MATTSSSAWGSSSSLSQVDFFELHNRKKRDVEIDMLDYDFVEQCNDLDLLKGILFTLRSGREGKYPRLEKATEDRILAILPEAKRNRILKMRNGPSHQEICQETQDLEAWANQIDRKSESLQAHKSRKDGTSYLPPVRGQMPPSNDENSPIQELSSSRDGDDKVACNPSKAIPAYDFRAWERYDVDQAIEQIDQEELAKQEEVKRLEQLRADRAKQRTKELASLPSYVNVEELSKEEREVFALHEKQKGNESFRVGDNEEALLFYSRSLAFDDTNAIVYANRAMTCLRLKQFANAEQDCSRAISLDPSYVKAWSRRGMARFRRGKYQEAMQDFEHALELQPDNKEIAQLLAKTKAKWADTDGTVAERLNQMHRDVKQSTSRVEELAPEQDNDEDHGDRPPYY